MRLDAELVVEDAVEDRGRGLVVEPGLELEDADLAAVDEGVLVFPRVQEVDQVVGDARGRVLCQKACDERRLHSRLPHLLFRQLTHEHVRQVVDHVAEDPEENFVVLIFLALS